MDKKTIGMISVILVIAFSVMAPLASAQHDDFIYDKINDVVLKYDVDGKCYEPWAGDNDEISRHGNDNIKDIINKTIYVLVDSEIYANIRNSLIVYKNDLENEGYTVEICTVATENPEDVRSLLQNGSEDLIGALLIGDIPVAWCNLSEEFPGSQPFSPFPCDIYYMDLDGTWTDIDGDGIPDEYTGDFDPEIWIGRLKADVLTLGDKNEIELLQNYFSKNHEYRVNGSTLPHNALNYYGSAGASPTELDLLYDNITVVYNNASSAADYKNKLLQNYEWIELNCHSSSGSHLFQTDGEWDGYVYSRDIRRIDPHTCFYNLLACYVCRYTNQNYIAGWYVFADTYGLVAIGETTTAGGANLPHFYEPLSNGKCIGEATKEFLTYWLETQPRWGMTIIGDPTLSPLDQPVFGNTIYFDPEDSSGLYCENNTLVEVRINSSVTIYGAQTDIYFDSNCVNITDVDFTGSSWPGPSWAHHGDHVTLAGFNPSGVPAGDNLFATIRLHCVNTKDCLSDLEFSGVTVCDIEANPFDITPYDGTFTFTSGNTIYLDPENSSGLYCENNTDVVVKINAGVSTINAQTDIYFDPSCVNITDADFTGSSWPGKLWHYGNYVRLIGSGTAPAGDNLFATITLHCVNESYCMSDLGFSAAIVVNELGKSFDLTPYNGTFTMKGDLNGDGRVDIDDVILCLRQAIGLDTQTPEADMNCDGIVDMSDVVLVLEIAIGLPLDSKIGVVPASFDVIQSPDTIGTDILKIRNDGKKTPLGYCIGVDKPWLHVDPWWGIVEPGNHTAINVSINTTALQPGDYSANINISSTDLDNPGVTVPVNLTVPEGGFAVAVLPLFSSVISGDTVNLTVKIISTENFDDKLHIYLSTEGLLPDNQADLSWFNWTEKNVTIPARGEITIPLRAEIPTGESGIKMFRVKVESTIWRTEGFGTGIFGIT